MVKGLGQEGLSSFSVAANAMNGANSMNVGDYGDYVPHGFRSSFRDWAAEETSFSREVCEMALAHSIGNKVESAYRRGDLFEKRKLMMSSWADWCNTKPTANGN